VKTIAHLLRERRDGDDQPGADSLDAAVDDFLANAVKGASPEKLGEGRRGPVREEESRRFERPVDGTAKPLAEVDAPALAGSIADLATDPARLLDLKGLILRRAFRYVRERFDDSTLDSVQDYLAKQRGVRLDDGGSDSRYPAPRAGLAGPSEGG
jgi:hypothetical protein